MDIEFKGKHKSITDFKWNDIPNFVVITGPNGTGKSQLLELIYNTVINKIGTSERVKIIGKSFKPNEVTFLRSEWHLSNTTYTDFSKVLHQQNSYFNNFTRNSIKPDSESKRQMNQIFKEIHKLTGKSNRKDVTREEFDHYFPELVIEHIGEISQKLSELFYNYRLSEIELQAKCKTKEEIVSDVGEKPWIVLREIIKESKLPFEINDPSNNGLRDAFQLKLTHTILKEDIKFTDLSSGEKVLISLVFYLYSSQEKNVFPKLLLMDEPDAHLHPSMSKQFIDVIKNVLVDKYDVQVIMTTHSPSTVILAPDESIYEMSITEPRIKKGTSKNHCVSLLTGGLVFVGEGTKYFLVEDKYDKDFYTYVYGQLTTENKIDSDVPLVFIPASTKDNSGGKNVVTNWVGKLKDSGLVGILQGLIDADSGNDISEGIYKIDRYSIENYLADPILVYAALVDVEKNPTVSSVKFSLGEEYKLKNLGSPILQEIADKIFDLVEPELKTVFTDFDEINETQKVEVSFTNDVKLLYPRWIKERRGKDIINKLYNKVFSSLVNQGSLFKALKKLNMFPNDLVNKFNEIKNG